MGSVRLRKVQNARHPAMPSVYLLYERTWDIGGE